MAMEQMCIEYQQVNECYWNAFGTEVKKMHYYKKSKNAKYW